MGSAIPPKPNFAAIEAAAPGSSDRRTLILALIGNLVFSWSNNESMFVYVLMLLLETDEVEATIVFATLNTTRARLELIERLAKTKIADKAVAKTLARLISRFNDCTRLRNEFNHCMYAVNEHGEITHTHSLKIQELRGQLRLGAVRPMDDDRIQEMLSTIRALRKLNHDIWSFLPELQEHLKPQSPTANVKS